MSDAGKGDDYRRIYMNKWYENYDRIFGKKEKVMASEKTHRPSTWAKMAGVKIVDADGWRSDQKNLMALITKSEFIKRLDRSTIIIEHSALYNNFKIGK